MAEEVAESQTNNDLLEDQKQSQATVDFVDDEQAKASADTKSAYVSTEGEQDEQIVEDSLVNQIPVSKEIIDEQRVEQKPEENAPNEELKKEQIEIRKSIEKEQTSDFILRRLTDDFLQPDVEPDIPSHVSDTSALAPNYEEAIPESKTERRVSVRRPTFSRMDREHRISGDFTVASPSGLFSAPLVEPYVEEVEEAELEESVQEEEIEITPELDREVYYNLYNSIKSELPSLKIRNTFLQKKMVEYFRRRKMDHVFKETDQQIDTKEKYHKRLDALHELLQLDEKRRLVINAELSELQKERDEKLDSVRKSMKQLLEKEKDTGVGLIHTKTGKEIPEKVLERLLRRQCFAAKQVAQHRLKYIKIRNKVTEKQNKLQAVDRIGDNLRLVDYEQLKVENRGYSDKIEERDEELTKLRTNCDSIFQILAHLREKSASTTLDILEEQKALQYIEIEFMEARERSNSFKVERDRYRNMVNRIRDESGLLFHSTMLKDMENALQEVKATKQALIEAKEKQNTQLTQLRAIRKNIEMSTNLKLLEKARIGIASTNKLTEMLHKVKPVIKAKKRSSK